MGWLVAAGLAVFSLVFWQALAGWWQARGRSGFRHPLLMVLIRDQAEVVEGLLRILLRLLAWSPATRAWEVMVLDAGSGDETPHIARRLLAGAGVSFVQAGPEWCRIVEDFAWGGRPVLLVPLLTAQGSSHLPDGVVYFLGGKSRMTFPDGELPD
ncbi:MAG: hypothetical protein AB1503_01070 [Bacillota bacterium]|nr:hypothetical protein [Bacillota bacterium]